jgi:NAD-dependent SIR2 family protein deacetylase
MDVRAPQDVFSVANLANFVARYRRLFVLSGAGISVESGIPGYRDADGQWKRTPPVFLQEFLDDHARRQRYWARSMVGWPTIAHALPNAAHRAMADLQRAGWIERLVTQNVDGLHQRAGSGDVIELHGNVDAVDCLECGHRHARRAIQERLERDNAPFACVGAAALPDGDADLQAIHLDTFVIPNCDRCGGMLKPSVVFFGESVPKDRVEDARSALAAADAMLVVGSSLMVYSGYRFCEWADKLRKPIAAVNLGRTRADHLFAIKIAGDCASTLPSLVDALSEPM